MCIFCKVCTIRRICKICRIFRIFRIFRIYRICKKFLSKDQKSKISESESSINSRTCLGHLVLLAFYQLYTLVIESFCRCLTISIRSVDCTRCMCTFQYKMFPFCASSIMVCVHLVSFHRLVGQGNIMNA